MLERVEQIQGIGLLHDANGKPFKWHKGTLIYADNGRGKSTLASVLRSAATGDASLVTARATVDGTLPPSAILQFGSGHKVIFAAGKWSEPRPELLVFDSDFIEKNVHSGGVVSTGQRKNLLQFALGDKAVAARLAEDKATNDAKAASDVVLQLSQQLTGYHLGTTLAVFEKLAEVADADRRIDVDRECESPYYRHHRLLLDFVANGSGDPTHVAKAIRPLLEGYLHRRFPGLIPQDLIFGQVVAFINDAKPPQPVYFAKGLVSELNEINDYAGQFHHDTNPGKVDTVVIVPSELRTYAERALNIVHKGNP